MKPDCSKGNLCHDLHGEATVTVNVLTDGSVGDTYPKGTNQILMDAAEEAARHCRFEPGTFAGKPTSMNFDLHYKF
ncbi:energy transducer TonB [Occallatibacter savannae]|uniref:energy transducer TonB n=1 Tax=Occallatibacter savannae TaxID=1002691 RepID=UPI0013A5A035|nr:energy transducer TonB [Occallatibacter savannae]